MKDGKSEKPRADIAHDSNENQTVEVRIAKRLTSLAAAYFGGRRNLPYTEVASLGQRVVTIAEERYRIFPGLAFSVSDAVELLTERGEFNLRRAIRCTYEGSGFNPSDEERYGILAVLSQDGSERSYIQLVIAKKSELDFLAAGLPGNRSSRVLCGEFSGAFTSTAGDVEDALYEFWGFVSRFF